MDVAQLFELLSFILLQSFIQNSRAKWITAERTSLAQLISSSKRSINQKRDNMLQVYQSARRYRECERVNKFTSAVHLLKNGSSQSLVISSEI